MIHGFPRRWLLTLAALAGALVWATGPAAADSLYFGYSSGPRHHYRPHYPYYRYGYYYPPPYYYAPAPVYYAPPPPVVYVPAAPPAPLAAMPTSPAYRTSDGRYCREYQATVTVNGGPQPSYGTACLQPDGSWRVVN